MSQAFVMPTGGDLRYNWLVVVMDAIDFAEMREIMLDAWSMVVPQRVVDEPLAQHPGSQAVDGSA